MSDTVIDLQRPENADKSLPLSLRISELEEIFEVLQDMLQMTFNTPRELDQILRGIEMILAYGRLRAQQIESDAVRLECGQEAPVDSYPAPVGKPRSEVAQRHYDASPRPEEANDAPDPIPGGPWTLERLIDCTGAIHQHLSDDTESSAYTTWREDLADAEVGIHDTDDWPTIRSKLHDHWARLESGYARRWWVHLWYVRHLAPRSPASPAEET